MNNKEILANAPEGATHYSIESECYYMLDDMHWNEIDDYSVISINSPEYLIRSLADIQRIVETEAEVKRLRSELPPTETGTNEYGLDVAYFRKTINRELNIGLSRFKPDEIARVLARLSIAADKSVINEPEFNRVNNLEQQAKGAFIVINNVLGEPESLTCEAAQWRRELIGRANQLRHQAKELKS